jgi:hypothetical protein
LWQQTRGGITHQLSQALVDRPKGSLFQLRPGR